VPLVDVLETAYWRTC